MRVVYKGIWCALTIYSHASSNWNLLLANYYPTMISNQVIGWRIQLMLVLCVTNYSPLNEDKYPTISQYNAIHDYLPHPLYKIGNRTCLFHYELHFKTKFKRVRYSNYRPFTIIGYMAFFIYPTIHMMSHVFSYIPRRLVPM